MQSKKTQVWYEHVRSARRNAREVGCNRSQWEFRWKRNLLDIKDIESVYHGVGFKEGGSPHVEMHTRSLHAETAKGEKKGPRSTVVQNNQESGRKYWATCLSVHLFARTLLASLTCSAALIQSLALLTHSQACVKVNDKMSQNLVVLNQSA